MIRWYLDEDSMRTALVRGLRRQSIDVITAWAAGMRQKKDEAHLMYAAAQGRVVFTANTRDFCRLHTEFLNAFRNHAGIVIDSKPQLSVGAKLRRMQNLMAARSELDMQDRIEFLSSW